jgi:hypothetical protein
MALASTQPLTEMSMRNLPGCKGRPMREADNLTSICEPILENVGASTACYRDGFTFLPVADKKYGRPIKQGIFFVSSPPEVGNKTHIRNALDFMLEN